MNYSYMLVLGAIGAFIIVLAWAINAAEAVERHKRLLDLKFASISAVGTGILIYYSWYVGETVFFFLQVMLFIAIMFEVFYSLYFKKLHKRKGRRFGTKSKRRRKIGGLRSHSL